MTDVGIPVCCRGEPPVAGGEEAGGAETDGNFDRFDINADGFLSQREIKAFMTEMGFHAKPDYLRDLIGNFGVEVSGFLPGRFAHRLTVADRPRLRSAGPGLRGPAGLRGSVRAPVPGGRRRVVSGGCLLCPARVLS